MGRSPRGPRCHGYEVQGVRHPGRKTSGGQGLEGGGGFPHDYSPEWAEAHQPGDETQDTGFRAFSSQTPDGKRDGRILRGADAGGVQYAVLQESGT